jgi:hypothetical protein
MNEKFDKQLYDKGMKCLCDQLGPYEAIDFITLIGGKYDYTEWRREYLWPNMTIDDINELWKEQQRKKQQEANSKQLQKSKLIHSVAEQTVAA